MKAELLILRKKKSVGQCMSTRHPDSQRKLDHFDWSKMRFATDRVTIASLREKSDDDFGFKRMEIMDISIFDELETVMQLERELAQIAYCQAAGIPQADAGVEYSERGPTVMRLLFEDYDRLGITAGKTESREWIQSIEAQARRQARPFETKQR